MSNPSQENRLLVLSTVLGADKLLIRSIDGVEGISQLYSYRVEATAFNTETIDFGALIGTSAWVTAVLDRAADASKLRYFYGIVQSVSRGARGNTATAYTLTLVPPLWFLTRRVQSRIFQQQTVVDILHTVLTGQDVVWETQGTFEPRDYCVQYRESDFDFASRLMEEEGIFYFFKFDESSKTVKMVVTNSPQSHLELPVTATLPYDPDLGGQESGDLIYAWEKSQTIRSGKTTLRDHTFELPHQNLEAQSLISDTITIGTATHKLKIAGNENLELYDFPGGYAGRFDGISPSGGEQASELQKIFTDNARTAGIRMAQEAVNSVSLTAYTTFFGITPGFKFTLSDHFEDNDTYVITRSHFTIPQMGLYGAGDTDPDIAPEMSFNCIPLALPFRPQRVTPKPVVHGTQTAVVTGPSGDEIHTDKYGRIKVQFLWDREGTFAATSSCWVRCAFPWAGKNFGFITIPRVGHEVVIAFQEGDPDQPICVGSVYNADTLPPWTLPDNKTQSGIQTRTSGGGTGNLNVLQFEDKKDAQFVFLQAEKDFHTEVKKDSYSHFGQDFHRQVERDLIEEIKNDVHLKVGNNVFEEVTTNVKSKIGGTLDAQIVGNVAYKADANYHVKVGGDHVENTTGKIDLKATNINLDASAGISLKVGGNSVVISSSGISVDGSMVAIKGSQVLINSGGTSSGTAAGSAKAASITAPKAITAPMKAGTTGTATYSGQAQNAPAHALPPTGTPPAAAKAAAAPPAGSEKETTQAAESQSEKQTSEKAPQQHYIEIELKDVDGAPVPGEYVEVLTPEGTRATGTTDEKGFLRVDGIQPGNATVRFPNRDKSVVE